MLDWVHDGELFTITGAEVYMADKLHIAQPATGI